MAADSVTLIECPRDAWQGLKRQIPTELKVSYLRQLVTAGFKHIDAVSFVSPKAVPQMADSEQVLSQLQLPEDVEVIGIVVNEKGADRAIATNAVTTLGFPCSISETFLRKNQNQSLADNLQVLRSIKQRADTSGLNIVAYVSMAFGNPYGDAWNEDELQTAVRRIGEIGIGTVSLADTVGVADAELIGRTLNAAIQNFSAVEIGVHMHSRRERAGAKVLAAFDAGCRRFDSAIGGLGGCPFAQDALVGNIPTETVIEALQRRGIDLPIAQSLQTAMRLNREIATTFE
jgi:hydroxymethylglutaryl-CoA lyase